jgi:hypothetical protein
MAEDSLRKELLSKAYSNLGIGSYCSEDETFECVTLLVFTRDYLLFNDSLETDYLKLYDIYYYLPSIMTLEKTATITFSSSKVATVYLVKSPDAYKTLLNRGSVDEVFKERSLNFTKTVLIKPGYSIVVQGDQDDTDYQLRIE